VLKQIELDVLATVDRGDAISDLATKLDHSESYISRAVGDLEKKELIHTERDGRHKLVVPTHAAPVATYQTLVREYPHIDFADLLTGKALEVLYYLDGPRTVSEIADESGNYRNTVNRVLKRFRDRGIVGVENSRYQFNGEFDRLHTFAVELSHHFHRQRLESVAPSGTILWENYTEFLAQTDTAIESEPFHETGLAKFAEYNLQFLLPSHRHYFFSEAIDSITPATLCCHTLLIDGETRYRLYCLLLMSQLPIAPGDLREQAAKYGLTDEIESMLQYLDTHGDVEERWLPEWDAFEELAADYEVAVQS
jgi:DNA-binding MarR family transcriptional regulator